jgi:hypothetical protein
MLLFIFLSSLVAPNVAPSSSYMQRLGWPKLCGQAAQILSLLLLTLVFSSCGHKDSAAPASASGQFWLTGSEINKLGLPPLKCQASSDACLQAVGQLVTLPPHGLSLCTATLIQPDVILTASHCVPWENLNTDQSLPGGCWFRTPGSAVASRCIKLLAASKLTSAQSQVVQPDFAYIQLEKPLDIKPLALAPVIYEQTGMINSRAHSLLAPPSSPASPAAPVQANSHHFLVARIGDPAAHYMKELHCRLDPQAQLFQKTWNPERVAVFADCPLRPGDSGGPLLDERGHVQGVISMDWIDGHDQQVMLSIVTMPEPLLLPPK